MNEYEDKLWQLSHPAIAQRKKILHTPKYIYNMTTEEKQLEYEQNYTTVEARALHPRIQISELGLLIMQVITPLNGMGLTNDKVKLLSYLYSAGRLEQNQPQYKHEISHLKTVLQIRDWNQTYYYLLERNIIKAA